MATNSSILHLEFGPSDDPQLRSEGYGKGILYLDDRPFWFSNTESEPQPVEWTWVDFLEHLAVIWAPLISEQGYTFEWLTNMAPDPGNMWRCAESRWSLLGDAVADTEEPILYDFLRRHNLAAGWKGIAFPALFCLRVSNDILLLPENTVPLRASFTTFQGAAQTAGDLLASAFEHYQSARHFGSTCVAIESRAARRLLS